MKDTDEHKIPKHMPWKVHPRSEKRKARGDHSINPAKVNTTDPEPRP